MKSQTTTINNSGDYSLVVVIPILAREALGVKGGDRLRWEVEDGTVKVVKEQ